jgi:hypothetical protein
MAHPDDVARWICEGDRTASFTPTFRYGLFGHDLEKGVVLRGRLRGAWITTRDLKAESIRRMDEFLHEPPPLGP